MAVVSLSAYALSIMHTPPPAPEMVIARARSSFSGSRDLPLPGPRSIMQHQDHALDTTDMTLRDHLREHMLAAQAADQVASHSYSTSPHDPLRSSPGHHEHNIDPAIAGGLGHGYALGANDSGGDDTLMDGKKGGKRELSQSKRAAQNRAAQRAFRQRKEGYIKKLEEDTRQLQTLTENFKQIQAENFQLRDYVINLQSRLIEAQGDYPQPPVDLRDPRAEDPLQSHLSAPTAAMGQTAVNQLQAAAAAAQAGDLKSSPYDTSDATSSLARYIEEQQRQQDHENQEKAEKPAEASAQGQA